MKRARKNLLILALFSSITAGCNTASTSGNEADTTASIEASGTVADGHTSRNSLDYVGTYNGTLPCADCEGIETTLTLNEGDSYHKSSTYLGKDAPKSFEEEGKYRWDEAGRTITLEGIDAPNQYLVGENTLTQLNRSGEKITGDLAEMYVLKK